MSIPDFNKSGRLNQGIHKCDTQEFIDRFCKGKDTIRSRYIAVLEELFAFCLSRNGKSVIIGGSFITNKDEPNDLDCMIILPNEKCCSVQPNEILSVEGCEIDVMVMAESNRDSIYSFLNLFSMDKMDIEVGLVEVILDEDKDKSTWDDYKDYFSLETLLLQREAYINRHVIRGSSERKILITVLSSEEYFLFNYKITPMVSSAGWIFAPYIYVSNDLDKEYEKFKRWISEIYYQYETKISVFADGIGALMIGMYLKNDLNYVKASFDKIILFNALLSPHFDWDQEVEHKVGLIINLEDKQGKSNILKTLSKGVKKHPLYGTAFCDGFVTNSTRVVKLEYDYSEKLEYNIFRNTIFPLYQTCKAIENNFEQALFDDMYQIRTGDVSVKDIIFNK